MSEVKTSNPPPSVEVSGTIDRRRHERTELLVPVTLIVGAEKQLQVAQLRNLSASGMFLEIRGAAPAGNVMVELELRKSGRICRARGRVVRGTGAGWGVEFEKVSDELAELVHDLQTLPPDQRNEFLAAVLEPRVALKSMDGVPLAAKK